MRFSAARTGLAALVMCAFATGTASAASFSFTGTFSTDDQLAQIPFSLSSPATITTVTYSYAGGTNQAGTNIPEGGFDPYLAIFDATGNLIQQNDNGTCFTQVPQDSVTGSCFDSYISQTLAAGAYTLILSQSPNSPVDNQLADGYTQTGNPNFTGSFYGCSNGMFCDANSDNRSPDWAVDIDNVTTAGSTVPEPRTVPLVGGVIGALSIWRRRRSAA